MVAIWVQISYSVEIRVGYGEDMGGSVVLNVVFIFYISNWKTFCFDFLSFV